MIDSKGGNLILLLLGARSIDMGIRTGSESDDEPHDLARSDSAIGLCCGDGYMRSGIQLFVGLRKGELSKEICIDVIRGQTVNVGSFKESLLNHALGVNQVVTRERDASLYSSGHRVADPECVNQGRRCIGKQWIGDRAALRKVSKDSL